ncbi:MAG: hypothetical protein CVV27_01020 [Candidatus Melainabacteria bacterium HGW-Melainabacteria-1]|nr:MAG: hypothetical protein CVV27_01020 [Candidatus Melainabacteria bacterium HGW-Melainabacteria-1]
MSIERLLKAFELEKRVLGAGKLSCPRQVIEAAERALGVRFPPTYRYYLEHIHLNTSTPILGVSVAQDGGLSKYSGVFLTFDARKYEIPLPPKYVLIDQEHGFQHVIDTTQVNSSQQSPVFSWHAEEFLLKYADFDAFYLERVNGAIYSYMIEKADEDEEGLSREEVEAYIQLHHSLGFTETEHEFLRRHWDTLRDQAN